MSAEIHAQQLDGTWQPAAPFPMVEGIDWEVYGSGKGPFHAEAFKGYGPPVAVVTSRNRRWLVAKVAFKNWRLTRAH